MIDHPRPRGRISFARVPFEAPWYRRLSQPLVAVSNAALAAWIYPCWRTARVRWSPPLDDLVELVRETQRPLIFFSWHAYEPVTLCAFKGVPHDIMPTGIGHDGLLSRMLQHATAWLGFRLWVYRRKSPISPKQQIIDMVTARGCNIGLFADAGGPYGQVKRGLPEIARATDAWLVPVIVGGHPLVRFMWPRRYIFPLPFCTLEASSGPPIDGREATTDICQQALRALEQRTSQPGD